MAVCPSCGAEGMVTGAPCARCGQGSVTSRDQAPELDIPVQAPRQPPPKKKVEEEPLKIELAADPHPVDNGTAAPAPGTASMVKPAPWPRSMRPGAPAFLTAGGRTETEDEFAARMLADYGEPPKQWFLSPLYAYRVFTRQGELRKALVGRREEAIVAQTEADDALVAFADRVRAKAHDDAQYARPLDELKHAEELLRSRDHVLAKEQDAHAERLRSIDLRISKLESELADARHEERGVIEELTQAETALERATAKLKRAEIELRNTAQATAKRTGIV